MSETDVMTQGRGKLDLLRERLNSTLLGKEDCIEMVLACLLARGHMLLDDLPGLGKTMLAKAVAAAIGGEFARIQCTPDLLPTDVTGFSLFNQQTREFEFHPGPVFSDILLADELNRTTPRTQSALFEAMAERQVTIENKTRALSRSFFVLATQNPIDSHGAYPLPEAQLDRFAMRLEIGYPDRSTQLRILEQAAEGEPEFSANHSQSKTPILTLEELGKLQAEVARIRVAAPVREYLVSLCEASRSHELVQLGVSPRGMLIWQRVAQARALLESRDYVIPADVLDVAPAVLGVRLVVRGGAMVEEVVGLICQRVEVPMWK